MSFLSDITDFLNDAIDTGINVGRNIKNYSLSTIAQKIINDNIKEYGKMVNLKIDSKNKNIELEVLLKGEKENIVININNYEIVNKNDSKYINFNKISASREWIEVLINNVIVPNYAPKKMFEIDSAYAKFIDLLI